MTEQIAQALARWSVPYLFPYQELVIRRLLDNDSVRQAVVLPTGSGKSLCFQLPALFFPLPTLVIYPLRSLTADQRRRCAQAGLRCVVLQGGQTHQQRSAVWEALAKREADLVLTNPETLLSPKVLSRLKSFQFSHAVVDEAHCVELWGNSFRPSYRRLAEVLSGWSLPRMTAFTATATSRVVEDWATSLFGTTDFQLVRASADRSNLDFVVEKVLSTRKSLPRTILAEARPAVVFCRSRELVRRWAHHLHANTALEVRFYHAGLSRAEKQSIEQWFLESRDGVLVATNAYGMGVDKPDIRTVIHLERPPAVEDYLQEAGRAGRDGKPARAIVYAASRNDEEALGCRRAALLEAVGETEVACSGCDVCRGQDRAPPRDVGLVLRHLKPLVRRLERRRVRGFLTGRVDPGDRPFRTPRTGKALWVDEDDLTAEELWAGLERGHWIRFYRWGPWRSLLAPLPLR